MATQHYNKYLRSRRVANLSLGLGAGFVLIGGIIIIDSDDDFVRSIPGYLIGGIGSALIILAIPSKIIASRQLGKAIDVYNQAYSFQSDQKDQPFVEFVLSNSGAGLILNF